MEEKNTPFDQMYELEACVGRWARRALIVVVMLGIAACTKYFI